MPIANHQDMQSHFIYRYSCVLVSTNLAAVTWLAAVGRSHGESIGDASIFPVLPLLALRLLQNEIKVHVCLLRKRHCLLKRCWHFRDRQSPVFFCCHPDVMRGGRCCTEKNDQRSGCFGLDTSFYLWLQPMVKLQRDGGRTKETNFNREYGNKATTMKDWKLFFRNSFSASR